MYLSLTSQIYIAIIGDIIHSKEIEDRNATQAELKSLLKRINVKYEDSIASNFMITLGDEFQGLLNYGEDVMNIISDIELEMFPIRIRFGVGIGTLTTEVNREIPLGADGPAYYNARKMIDELKKIERMNRKSDSNIMIASEKNHDNDMMLNAILSLCFTLQSKWTKRQREIISSYIKSEENQYKTADKLKISQSSVNKALIGSGFYSYQNGIETVSNFLSGIKGEQYV